MTRNHRSDRDRPPNTGSADNHADDMDDMDILRDWYLYAGHQPGSVGELLSLLRHRLQQTPDEQRAEFGISPIEFMRLASMQEPRPDRFASDATRMAEVCKVGRTFDFVQALQLARGLRIAQASSVGLEDAYEAAFDATDAYDTDDTDAGASGNNDFVDRE